jgi:lipoprotein-releasing system permease protein
MDDAPSVLPGIILGSELARTLSVDIGDDIQLIAPDGDIGPTGLRPKAAPFRVAAIFHTGMYEYDQKLAYTTVDAAQRFFNLGAERNAFEAHVERPEEASALAEQLRSKLGANFVVATFQERNANLFAALMLERLIMLIILGFIIFVASLLIVISLVMFVIEKMREVAVLKALGARNSQVVGGFVTIGGIIASFGILIGIPLGVGTCFALIASGLSLPREFYIRTLPVKLDPVDITLFGLAALGICLLATVYPALRAARLQPADGIRNG